MVALLLGPGWHLQSLPNNSGPENGNLRHQIAQHGHVGSADLFSTGNQKELEVDARLAGWCDICASRRASRQCAAGTDRMC